MNGNYTNRIKFGLPNILVALCYTMCMALISCDGDPPDLGDYTGKEVVYLFDGGDSFYAVNGSIIFKEKKNGSLEAEINLNNTQEGGSHPAIIYAGKKASSGNVLLTLNPVDGNDGKSVTEFSVLDDDSPINFAELLLIDAHARILLSQQQTQELAATNLGKNSASSPNID